MKTSRKMILVTAFAGTLGFSGLVQAVQAAQFPPQVVVMSQHQGYPQIAAASDGDRETNDAAKVPQKAQKLETQAITSSSSTQVSQASRGDVETNDSAKEQPKTANLHSLAKITPQQAQKAAETVQGGKASRVKLENENGNLVYAVTIGQQELLVDAGNGRVLSSSNPNTEQNEGLQTRSSVQIAHPSHGDGETNDGKEK